MISIVIPLYVNKLIPETSLNWYNEIAKVCSVQVIIVDDGSTVKIGYGNYPYIKFIRINEDIEWNQPKASNLGVENSVFKYILHTNIDCLVNKETIELLKSYHPRKREVFKFKRIHRGDEIKPHPNVYLISKEDYMPGYDEDFCGNYGNDDKYFFATKNLKQTVIDQYIISIDTNSHDLVRDRKVNEEKFINKLSYASKS